MEGQPPPPPPPPPHGTNAPGGRSGGLPDGKYDIFVIPPSSAGSGFLYLPSLQTQRNSFIAGVICTAAVFFIWNVTVPAVKAWFYDTMYGGGGSGIVVLLLGVGVLSWAFGKTQAEASQGGPSSTSGAGNTSGASGTFNPGGGTYSGPPPQSGPKSSWQRPPPQANTKANTTNAKTSWEKAREETRKKEEEKRKTEELKKRREELEKERQKQRDKEAQERLERERKERKEREDRDAANKAKASPKRPPMPTARTEEEDDAYSFRPYDRPRRPYKANSAASMYSESSYAASQTTARTTPPPVNHGPYATKDPDKIIIRGVYAFNNAFMRTPTQQLVSGQGSVTDGLILRITTEGLFIDDDKRGVPQREWDVKAWTMKLAEVWCPNLPHNKGSSPSKRKLTPFAAAASRQVVIPSATESDAFVSVLLHHCNSGDSKPAKVSRWSSRVIADPHEPIDSGADNSLPQSCEMAGLHVLRASIRDQEGKKYVFILSQSEGWKVAVGLQRLRRGSQVRAMGVAGMPMNEAKALLENLGYV